MRLSEHLYRSVSTLRGHLIFVEKVFSVRIGEVVKIITPEGITMEGGVLRIERDTVLIQVYGDTRGLNIGDSSVLFTDSIKKAPLSIDIVGRIFNGAYKPIDDLPMFIPERFVPVTGYPINPASRERPRDFIETGLSAIDGLNTLVRGQKLPIFSCAGLPAKEVAGFILKNARTKGNKGFVIIFIALGITHLEYSFYKGILDHMVTEYVAIVNRADEPVMERLLAPRFGLTIAEYLAFEKGMDVIVLMTDMVNYCDALREVSSAREELPARRGYPGYMYSDLASLYERAGRIKDIEGSITIIPVLTMPEDDITHPIPDLTGYITEGQIVLSREMHQKGIFPPIDILPSLSRLMQSGIGEGRTRSDHRKIANLLYRNYARGRDLRRLEAIVGREGMSVEDRKFLDFANTVEREFINQGIKRRDISETLNTGKEILQRYLLL